MIDDRWFCPRRPGQNLEIQASEGCLEVPQLSGIRSVTLSEHTRQKDDWGSQAQVTQTQQRTVSEPRSHKFVRLLWITHLSGSYLELSLTFPPVVLIRDQRLIVSQLVQLPSSLVVPAARVPTVVITRIE